jgi:hypothetical protein
MSMNLDYLSIRNVAFKREESYDTEDWAVYENALLLRLT